MSDQGGAGPRPCQACGGAGVTQQTRHSIDTAPDGTMTPKVETFLGQCGSCHGSGMSF